MQTNRVFIWLYPRREDIRGVYVRGATACLSRMDAGEHQEKLLGVDLEGKNTTKKRTIGDCCMILCCSADRTMRREQSATGTLARRGRQRSPCISSGSWDVTTTDGSRFVSSEFIPGFCAGFLLCVVVYTRYVLIVRVLLYCL